MQPLLYSYNSGNGSILLLGNRSTGVVQRGMHVLTMIKTTRWMVPFRNGWWNKVKYITRLHAVIFIINYLSTVKPTQNENVVLSWLYYLLFLSVYLSSSSVPSLHCHSNLSTQMLLTHSNHGKLLESFNKIPICNFLSLGGHLHVLGYVNGPVCWRQFCPQRRGVCLDWFSRFCDHSQINWWTQAVRKGISCQAMHR